LLSASRVLDNERPSARAGGRSFSLPDSLRRELRVASNNDEWANLINGLGILWYGKYTDTAPTHCEHDKLTVMSNPEEFTSDQLAQLERLGFVPDWDDLTFSSSRFGRA
jgi:hypothetical protein